MRRQFRDAWQRVTSGAAASDLDRQIAAVVEWHPEYHAFLLNDAGLERDYTPEMGETNPFLHLGLHLAVREQLATNRPAGVRACFEALRRATGDEHAAEHVMLERLGEALHAAQRNGVAPDESAYLESLRDAARTFGRPPGPSL